MKLSLKYPLKVIAINQPFGASPEIYSKPEFGGMKGHNGVDFRASHGTPVYATHDGLASFQIDSGGGHGVVILTNDKFDFENNQVYFKTIYWHLCDGLKEPQYQSPIADKTGMVSVKTGDLIGYADNTGGSTGDHLHFGLKPVAPGEFPGVWSNWAQNNGYLGAIDPMPYFETVKEIQDQIHVAQLKLIDVLNLLKSYLLSKLK